MHLCTLYTSDFLKSDKRSLLDWSSSEIQIFYSPDISYLLVVPEGNREKNCQTSDIFESQGKPNILIKQD